VREESEERDEPREPQQVRRGDVHHLSRNRISQRNARTPAPAVDWQGDWRRRLPVIHARAHARVWCGAVRRAAVCMRCVCKLLCTRLFACASCGRQANGGARRWCIPEASSGRCRRLGTGAFPAPARRACSGKKNTIKLALVVASPLPGCKAALVSCLTGDHNTQHTVRYDRQHAVHTRSHVARIIQPCRSAAQRASMARRTRGGGRVSQPAGSARTERRRPCQRRLGSSRATCAYRQAGSAASVSRG
jgi:hypothetical protein